MSKRNLTISDAVKIPGSDLLTIFAIVSAGLVLRLWQINWGLPELYEEATPMKIAWGFWNWNKSGFDFNPHFFNYPALTFYIHFLVQVLHFCVGFLFGVYENLNSFGLTLIPLSTTARLINVVFDTGTIIAVFFIAKDIANLRTALVSAAVVAINPLHVSHAHLIEVDTVLTFFSTLSMLYILRVYHQPGMKWYILSGVCIALAASAKYTGALLLVVLMGAHFLRRSSANNGSQFRNLKPLMFSVAISVAGFFAINPFILFNFEKFKEDFTYEQFHVSYGHLGVVSSKSTVAYYLADVIPSSFGWLFSLILVGTIIPIIVSRKKGDVLLLLYPVIYLTIVSMWAMRADRYILPIFPIVSILGSIGIVRMYDWLMRYFAQRHVNLIQSAGAQGAIVVVITVAILFQPGLASGRYLRSLALPDTRTVTKNWIRNNLAAGSVIATGPYGIEFPDTSYRTFMIPFRVIGSEFTAPFYDTRWYEDCDLLIASSFDYDRYVQEPGKYALFLNYYNTLKTKWKLIREIKPSEFQNGPAFWLYTFPDSLRREKFDMSMFQRLNHSVESLRINNFLKELNAIEMSKQQFTKSEQLLQEILDVEVNNYSLHNLLAQSLFLQDKYYGALNQLEISLRTNPNQARAIAFSGIILSRLNRTKESEEMLQKANTIDANLELPYQELMDLYISRREKIKLLDVLRRYSAILPNGTQKSEEIKNLIDQVQRLP